MSLYECRTTYSQSKHSMVMLFFGGVKNKEEVYNQVGGWIQKQSRCFPISNHGQRFTSRSSL